MKIHRKAFLRSLGLTGAAMMLGARTASRNSVPPSENQLTLGLASYTFRKFSLDDTIAAAKRLQLERIALKSMHMPLEASDAETAAAAKKVREAGLDLYGAGVIYMTSEQEVNRAFDYARAAQLRIIIGVPAHNLLPLVEKKVKEYNIKVAIHNHGPEDKLYPGPGDVYEKVKTLDSRIGLCMDIGHTTRLKQDPIAAAKMYRDRLYDCHMKDLDENGEDVPAGHGVIDIPGFVHTLRDINYAGSVSFEFEKNGDDPLPGLAESVGFVRGVLKC